MPTVLIVDDEQSICAFLTELLEDQGYQVLCAGNGRDALALAQTHVLDLILSDVMMPLMDGLTLVTHLRATAQTQPIPIILMSAAVALDRITDRRGITFLPKPFTLPQVLRLVSQLLGDASGPSLTLEGPDSGPTLSA